MPLFDIDIPQLLADSMPGMYDGTLTRTTLGTRTVGNPGAGTNPTTAAITFKGFASTYRQQGRQLVKDATHTIIILAATMSTLGTIPQPGDTIVLTGDPELVTKTTTIVDTGVERDPASATWICHVKVPGG